ncbi:MAG TPA: redoxin domain-containing protein [Candidatus Acidoferrales bacterium]|nr:redoxin domain-containing protein [Candidatus Acidoferrales bacterium]
MRRISTIFVCLFLATAGYGKSEKLEKAPNFTSDAVWIDTGAAGKKVPHSVKGYRGRVLLVDFWEYTCINCIRDFSILKRWYAKYHRYGFDIVGVHFGEFPMGFNADNVRQAARRFQLPWPIVADVHGSIWNEYKSNVWPNRYLIDPNGNIVFHVGGEGGNRVIEEKIRTLLAAAHPEVNKIPPDPPENTFVPSCGITTDETYAGDWYGRGALANAKAYNDDGSATDFHADGEPQDGRVMLSGKWRPEQAGVTSGASQSHAVLRYHARSVYAVLSVENPKKPVRLDLLQDGKPVAREDAGVDVQFDAKGAYIEVSEPRMYYLVKNATFGSHLLTLEPQHSGLDLHSFTYGNNCQQNFDQR